MGNTIDPSLLYTNKQSADRKTGSDILGKDDFLKILMVQLQNQDPMNPMQDKDFIAQMATFSSLEQMTNMNQTMQQFVNSQIQSQLIDYTQFVGKQITWHKSTPSDDPNGQPTISQGSGIVTGVRFVDNAPKFILDDGTQLDAANISQVNAQSKDNSLVQASYLIGKKVTWLDDQNQEVTAIVKSAALKNGEIILGLDNDQNIKPDQLIKIEN